MGKTFALIGIAGYIAPRHLKAIKEIGGNLVAAYDIADRVGILDSYFPDCAFFTNEFDFYDFINDTQHIDYLVVCSPNYLHAEHCYAGLKLNADVICEKPLALTIDSLLHLQEAENYTGKRIYTILQLRLHPLLKALKQEIDAAQKAHYEVTIKYCTPRGKWYNASWKGNEKKSGGLATNIGIHLFDLAVWLFGNPINVHPDIHTASQSSGILHLQKATVHWQLSIEQHNTPNRQIIIDGKEYEFTDGFSDLHTASYEAILQGKGFVSNDVLPSISIVEKIRNHR